MKITYKMCNILHQHAHKAILPLLNFISFPPAVHSLVNSGDLFCHQFGTKKIVLFTISCVRMQLIFKMYNPVGKSILSLLVAYHINPLTCYLITSHVVQ